MLAIPGSARATEDRLPESLSGGPWNVYYADDACRLARVFGDGDAQVGIRMEWFSPQSNYEMTLSGKRFKSSSLRPSLTFGYGPGLGKAVEVMGAAGSLEGGIPIVIFVGPDMLNRAIGDSDVANLPTVTRDNEAAIRELRITFKKRPVVLQVGSMAGPMDAVRACLSNLVSGWGIDPAVQNSIAIQAEPKTRPNTWIVSNDYPRGALRGGEQAIVHFRLMVGADGKPTACNIQAATRGKEFSDATCRLLMQRAKFNPARTVDGRTVPTYYISSVRFVIP